MRVKMHKKKQYQMDGEGEVTGAHETHDTLSWRSADGFCVARRPK